MALPQMRAVFIKKKKKQAPLCVLQCNAMRFARKKIRLPFRDALVHNLADVPASTSAMAQ